MRRLLIALALLVSLPAWAQQAIPVTTEPARVGNMPVEVLANGLVVPESVVTIRTRVDGQITEVHVSEGQMVTRGQPLFTLDSRFYRAQLQQQEAQLAALRAQATRTQADAVRYQSLRGEGFAAQQRFEQAQAEAAAAAANARATEALMQQTRLNIEFAQIVAEADGKLGALPLRVGNFVRQAESTPLGTITQMDPILVQFAVPERWLPQIRAALAQPGGVPVQARPAAEGQEPSTGRLVFVDSAVDTQTGTIQLRARFDNADGALWPGQYVRISLTPTEDVGAVSVPSAAVQTGQQGRFVFVLTQEGIARRRPVELVRSQRDRAIVRGEIADGERVIVDGAQRVTDGARAQERNPQTPLQRVSQAG
ncbi:efflux RND transporter periplasmic adaptor subunit [Sabulicella rubraurantiaca]|uniref:efflux RND transporter periplasmic adaptor subunit n=1 Tax=Sabulicella rubraurantiaca TaxID=2811429 RepID=UPI001A967768|nr:efflux RND transporter periplasmic adaptor subunit [Sabulicella rubraurantiaca]